jgi:EAL domain-containing protein (putative c-di-GMP-specific phosphodiesterase class I)
VSDATPILDEQSLHPRSVSSPRKEPPLAAANIVRFRPIVSLGSGDPWGVEVTTDAHAPNPPLERVIREVPAIWAFTGRSVIVSANVAPTAFEREGFAREVAALLTEVSLDGSSLMLEMNERPRIGDLDTLVAEMRQLHRMGVRLAVDNFGQGFAFLEYLKRLPIDVVKISHSFVAGVGRGGGVAEFVAATLSLTATLGLEAIAMGVETEAQADALRDLSCPLAQGPLFPDLPAQPVTASLPVEVPLSLEPVLGWRVWQLDDDHGIPTLISLTRPDLWPPGEPFRATCEIGVHRGRVPEESCSCGVYAASSPEALAGAVALNRVVAVVGAIAMWGTVIEHERGARSEFAYPARLRLVCGLCLGEGRGAVEPVAVFASGTLLAPMCKRHAARRSGPTRPASEVQAALLSSYAVDLMPIERVSTTLKTPPSFADPLAGVKFDAIKRAAEGVGSVVLTILQALWFLWAISGMLIVAFVIIAAIVGLFIPDG